MSERIDPQGRQDRQPVPAGQDEVEEGDRYDNLGDADTLADLSDPAIDSAGDGGSDRQSDGERQATGEGDALGGLSEGDLGTGAAGLPVDRGTDAEEREGYAGLGPDTLQAGGASTGDRATGVTDLRG